MPNSRQVVILIMALLNTAGIIVGLVSTAWIKYCVDHIACSKTATTGIFSPQTFCVYETICIDALHFGVFAMLCSASVCSAYILYYIVMAMYQETMSPYRPVSGLSAMCNFLLIVIAQYTIVMVLFLKTNGMQQTTVSDLQWPFYVVWFSAVCTIIMFYIQPSILSNLLPKYGRR